MAGDESGLAHAMTRTGRIDGAISAASELIAHLQDAGPVNSAQARLLIEAAVRASVANAEQWEIVASAKRIAGELKGEGERRGNFTG